MKKKLVMVGCGMAGMKAIEEIIQIAPDMFEITIFGKERYPNYNRILLSSVLAGDKSPEEIVLHPLEWYREHGIRLHLGKEVSDIQRGWRRVIAEDGTEEDYNLLILATGSNPFVPPIKGTDKKGVFTFRDITDCERILEGAKYARRAVVIGGGLLGLEAAKGLRKQGLDVVVIHDQPTLMNLQLDPVAGELLKRELEKEGIRFLMSTLTDEIVGEERVEGVRFKDSKELICQMVVIACGIRPNIGLAKKMRLLCGKGVMVNDYMQTITDPSIYAVGECCEWRGRTYGLVAPLFEQAKILAYHITGQGFKSYMEPPIATKLKVEGVDVFSVGTIDSSAGDTIEYMDKSRNIYKKLVLKDNTLHGAVLFGDTSIGPYLMKLIQEGKKLEADPSTLLFNNPSLGNAGHSGVSVTSLMTDDTIVCGCNGVTKKMIVDAITEKGLTTRQEVSKHTRAGTSCGGCGPLIDEILATVLGGGFRQSPLEIPLCECTELSHRELKKAIREKRLLSVDSVIETLDWKEQGCHVCRPAINYYVKMFFPDRATDDIYSRHCNERLHANIQKDGTFSVVPRMRGGLTTVEELERIVAVAKRFNVTDIKLTGGQRIALMGVKKEDLPEIWRALEMPSGHAYGKALRTVKTCVGSRWCRFATQPSMELGIRLEKELEGIWSPAKLKLAVTGCPRNCAESTIKDIGIVGIEGGWEIYCGGNGGVRTRVAELLTVAKEEDEVVEVVKAFIQFYREDAFYGERTSQWIERIGMEAVKTKVLDEKERKELVERLNLYLSTVDKDPWQEDSVAAHSSDYLTVSIGG